MARNKKSSVVTRGCDSTVALMCETSKKQKKGDDKKNSRFSQGPALIRIEFSETANRKRHNLPRSRIYKYRLNAFILHIRIS